MTIISFIGVILIVVSVHELGHYLAARFFNVRVLRFSVGFGNPFWRHQDRHGTEWVLAPIPMGGYVRMLDRDYAKEQGLPDAETIEAQGHGKRIIIYAAGPLANIILSVLITATLNVGGTVGLRPVIGDINGSSPAVASGLSAGDVITAVNEEEILIWRQAELAMIDAIVAGDDIVIQTEQGVHRFPATSTLLGDIDRGIATVLGIVPYDAFLKPTIASVSAGSPAAQAGLQVDDTLVMIDGLLIDHWHNALTAIQQNPDRPIELVLWRAGTALKLQVTLTSTKKSGRRSIGYLGVAPTVVSDVLAGALVTVQYTPLQWLTNACAETMADITRTLGFLRLMLTGEVPASQVSGPIGIAAQSGEAAQFGIAAWLRFVAIISTSLAILNLLPLPVLDGGHILLSVIQFAVRSDFPDVFLRLWEVGGAVIMLLLTVWVIFNDFMQLFG